MRIRSDAYNIVLYMYVRHAIYRNIIKNHHRHCVRDRIMQCAHQHANPTEHAAGASTRALLAHAHARYDLPLPKCATGART